MSRLEVLVSDYVAAAIDSASRLTNLTKGSDSMIHSENPLYPASAIRVVSIVLPALLLTGIAQARQPGFYAGNKFQPLIVSPDEFVVEFDDAVDPAAIHQTMRATVNGSLAPIPWSPDDKRLAIMRISDNQQTRRAKARATAGVKSVHRVYRIRPGAQPILSTGTIVVALRPDVTPEQRDQLFSDYKVEWVRDVAGLKNTYIVRPTGSVDDVELSTAASLHEDFRTLYAHPDCRFPIRTTQVTTDPFFSNQFHLNNNGAGDATFDADIDIEVAWNRTLGAGVRVGQLDDSCDVMHEDLAGNYIGISHDISNNNQSSTAANPQQPGDRHGTSTMGLMVAGDNGIGVIGVAPNAAFTASRGLSGAITSSQVAAAFTFARNQEVDVHNNSWGFIDSPNPPVVVSAIDTAFTEGRGGLGMVVCFASGNGSGMEGDDDAGVEIDPNEDLAALPQVVGVGASNARDELAFYSNFGEEIDLLAPSNDFVIGANLPAVTTTDNTDSEFSGVEPGYNNNGLDDQGFANLADPNYTNNFGGTSAASPQVAGVAALILAVNPSLTASSVRVVMEQTADKINPTDADYNGITERSLRYGYGRINAGTAVEAVFDDFFWPERVADVQVNQTTKTLRWVQNDDIRTVGGVNFGVQTTSVLVVQSDSEFSFVPTDLINYQVGSTLTNENGGTVNADVVANLDTELFNYDDSQGPLFFGIYPVTQTTRGPTYGFGVSVSTVSGPIDAGTLGFESSGGNGGGILPPGSSKPNVSIQVSPLSGNSPLTVDFIGNAQSTAMIESFMWDFDDGSTSSQRVTEHTYIVPAGAQRFFPRLTVTDINGNIGGRAVAVDVFGADQTGGGDGGNDAQLSIVIADPQIPDVDIGGEGFTPLSVILSAEVTGVSSGALQAPDVFWDLGDGSTASSLTVSHTYVCPAPNVSCRFPITVTVDSAALTETLQATRFIEVLADPNATPTPTPTPTNGNGNGSDANMCGMGAMGAVWCMALLTLIRRKLAS